MPLPLADATRATLLRNTQRAGEPIDPEIALVMSTSGSTGTPKGAQLTPANLVASADATHQVLGGTGQWLLAMPAHHIAGIQVLVRSLVAGVDPLCMDLSEGFDIPTFARAAAELDRTGDRTYTALTRCNWPRPWIRSKASMRYAPLTPSSSAVRPSTRACAQRPRSWALQ